jgi:hypothetical protein
MPICTGMNDLRASGSARPVWRGILVVLLALLVPPAISLWPAAGAGRRPLPGEAGVRLALVLGAALVLVAVGAVHWRRWRLGLDSMQLALVVACLLSAGALLSLQVGRPWHLAWWDYHVFLLAGFAAAIYSVGLRLGLRPAALRALAEGAYLHDVGKVGIPDHVLNKPGALTEEEQAWIQEHPIVGTDIVGRALAPRSPQGDPPAPRALRRRRLP